MACKDFKVCYILSQDSNTCKLLTQDRNPLIFWTCCRQLTFVFFLNIGRDDSRGGFSRAFLSISLDWVSFITFVFRSVC